MKTVTLKLSHDELYALQTLLSFFEVKYKHRLFSRTSKVLNALLVEVIYKVATKCIISKKKNTIKLTIAQAHSILEIHVQVNIDIYIDSYEKIVLNSIVSQLDKATV